MEDGDCQLFWEIFHAVCISSKTPVVVRISPISRLHTAFVGFWDGAPGSGEVSENHCESQAATLLKFEEEAFSAVLLEFNEVRKINKNKLPRYFGVTYALVRRQKQLLGCKLKRNEMRAVHSRARHTNTHARMHTHTQTPVN